MSQKSRNTQTITPNPRTALAATIVDNEQRDDVDEISDDESVLNRNDFCITTLGVDLHPNRPVHHYQSKQDYTSDYLLLRQIRLRRRKVRLLLQPPTSVEKRIHHSEAFNANILHKRLDKRESSTQERCRKRITLAQGELVDRNWILLDSQSTVNIFKNRSLLENVHRDEYGIRCYSNGGKQKTTEVRELKGSGKNIGPVWYNNKAVANILSLGIVCKTYRVAMDTVNEIVMIAHVENNKKLKYCVHKDYLSMTSARIRICIRKT